MAFSGTPSGLASVCAATDYDSLVRVMLVGDSGVGKSSIVSCVCFGEVERKHLATIGVDFHSTNTTINGTRVKMQIWDTAGQERFRMLTPTYYRSAHAVVIVFDLTSHESFKSVESWVDEIKRYSPMSTQTVLVGNKSDCHETREVSREEAEGLAESMSCSYLETSALEADGVFEPFRLAASSVIEVGVEEPTEGGVDISKPAASSFRCCL